ncbi:MAG: hypothetical protein ACI96N_003433, partial [Arenicella sp.]
FIYSTSKSYVLEIGKLVLSIFIHSAIRYARKYINFIGLS